MGKTRLHEAALDEARRAAASACSGRPAPSSSRTSRFGVAGQLVRALLSELPDGRPPGVPGRGARAGPLAGRAPSGICRSPTSPRPDRVPRPVRRDGRRGRDATDAAGHRRSALGRRRLARVRPLRPAPARRAARRARHDPPPRRRPASLPSRSTGSPPIPGCGSRASVRSGSRPSRSSRATRSASEPIRLWSRCHSRSPAVTPSICASCCSRWPRTRAPPAPS